MKRTFLFVLMLVMCISINSFAQNNQKSVDFYKVTEWIQIPGTMTFGYIVDEDGNLVKNGAVTINCKESIPYKGGTVSGDYTLNANYDKGLLNGSAKSNSRCKVVAPNGESLEYVRTFSGSFKKGLPHGTFNVTYAINGDYDIQQTVNYKDGKLVGAYYNYYEDEENIYYGADMHLKGTLDEQGRLIGTWKVNEIDMQFQKGVLISETSSKFSTRPDLVELSKKYANGQITKEQLAEKNISIKQDTLNLGKYAKMVITEKSGFEFEELSGWDFSMENEVPYESLVETSMLTQSGLNMLIEYIQKGGYGSGSSISYEFGLYDQYRRGDDNDDVKYGVVRNEENGYCIKFFDEDQMRTYSKGSDKSGFVYLTEKQMTYLDSVVEVSLVENASTLHDYFRNVKQVERFREKGEELIKKLKTPYTGNGNYMLYDSDYKIKYFTKESVEEFGVRCDAMSDKNMYDRLMEEGDKLLHSKSYEGSLARYNEANMYEKKYSETTYSSYFDKDASAKCDKVKSVLRKIAEEKKAEEMRKIQVICDYMVVQKTSKNISNGDNVQRYFDLEGLNPGLGLGELIKPFCNIVGCKVVSYDESSREAVLEITKLISKKKGNIVYQVPVIIKGNRVLAKSIDFTKAIVVE